MSARLVTLCATPSDRPCRECDGEGWWDPDPWDCEAAAEPCPWCHGSGRELDPIPVERIARAIGEARRG